MPWKHLHSTKKAWMFGMSLALLSIAGYGIWEFWNNDETDNETIDSAQTSPIAEGTPSPKPNFASTAESLMHPTFECRKLYEEICFRPNKKDPSGKSSQTPEIEARVLRLFEELVRKHPKELPEEIDERLAKIIYTPERKENLEKLFLRTKTILKILVNRLVGQNREAYEFYAKRIDLLKLELPPPAKLYADERSILTGDDALYYAFNEVPSKIRIGGGLVNSINSKFNLIDSLSHEIAHSLSPCAIIQISMNWNFYAKALLCLGYTKNQILLECEHPGKMNEVLSDWFAAQVVVEIMKEDAIRFKFDEKRAAIKNAVRDLCDGDSENSDDPKNDWAKTHPTGPDRINGIFAQHPKIQRILQCDPTKKKMPFRISGQCYRFIDRD